jgi:MFS family permease
MAALRSSVYRRYAFGGLVSNVATWTLRLAQTLLVLDLSDGSGAAVGAVAALQFLPLLVLGPWIGVLADRHPKRALLQKANVIMAAIASITALLILTGAITVWQVYVLTVLFGIGAALDFPLRVSVVPELVGAHAVANGVALNAISVNLGRLVGPALAGLMTARWGVSAAFLFAAAGFASFAVMLALIPPSPAAATVPGSGHIREALQYIRRHEELMPLFVLIALAGIAGPNILNLAALMATSVFGEGPATVGVYGTVMAVGALAGAVGVVRLRQPSLRIVTRGALLLGAVTVAAATAGGPVSFGFLLGGCGLAAMVMVSTAMGLLQLSTEGPLRGRVTSLFAIVLFCGIPLGSPPLGLIADMAGVRWSIGIAGATVTLSAIAVRALAHRWTPVLETT